MEQITDELNVRNGWKADISEDGETLGRCPQSTTIISGPASDFGHEH
jgi:hypothetical protein